MGRSTRYSRELREARRCGGENVCENCERSEDFRMTREKVWRSIAN